jgi:TonB family protein
MSSVTTPRLSRVPIILRSFPRYRLAVPLDIVVLRSGVADRIPGRSIDIGAGGVGVMAAGEFNPGEIVGVEFQPVEVGPQLRAHAVVRYQLTLGCGLQFLRLSSEQQEVVQYWLARGEEVILPPQFTRKPPELREATAGGESTTRQLSARLKKLFNKRVLAVLVLILAVVSVLGWWRWQRGWEEIESQLPGQDAGTQPAIKLGADMVAPRVIHQVQPEYPDAARQARVEGTVLLDAVIAPDGTVSRLGVISGPEALVPAATDAVRWWRYEPYLVNGKPAAVETTVAVDFRLQQ